MSERWLITGARGFLGRHVLAALDGHGVEVVSLDRGEAARPSGLVADLTLEPPDLSAACPGVVVHLASLVHHDVTGAEYERAIVGGTRNLLAGLDEIPEPPHTFIYASSIAVYGLWEGELLPETTPALATSPYGRSKRMAEELVYDWAVRRSCRAVVLRLPALIGRGMRGSLAALVTALRRRTYLALGDGRARRSFVLASDVARVLPRLLREEGVFHLTDGSNPTFREIETRVRQALGRRPPPRIPMPLARALARAGDLSSRVGAPIGLTSESLRRATSSLTFDDSAAVERFGWSPRTVLDHPDEWIG